MSDSMLEYVSPSGDRFTLVSPTARYEVAFIEGGTLEGLVGQFEDPADAVPGVPGAVFRHEDRSVLPMTGSFDAVTLPGQSARFYAAFSTFRGGLLRLTNDVGTFVLPVRLAAALPLRPGKESANRRVPVSVVADGGVWLFQQEAAGRVDVVNFGDVPCTPLVIPPPAGGTVVLPSGAEMVLPEALEAGRLVPLTEAVPPGQTATVTIPDGATLLWDVGVLNPWT